MADKTVFEQTMEEHIQSAMEEIANPSTPDSVAKADTTHDGRNDVVGVDTDGDGTYDVVLMDTTDDGKLDTAMVDTVGDGVLDTVVDLEKK